MNFNPDAQHQPTPHRIRQAREQGLFAHSRDLVWAAIWVTGFCGVAWFGESILQNWQRATHDAWTVTSLSRSEVLETSNHFYQVFASVLPVLLLICGGAILFNLVQGGFRIQWERIIPKVSRLYERERKVTLDKTINALASLLKIASIVSVSCLFLYFKRQEIAGLDQYEVEQSFVKTSMLFNAFALQVAIVLVIWGMLDFGLARIAFLRRLKMTEQELRDEQRLADGNTQIHSIRYQLPYRNQIFQPVDPRGQVSSSEEEPEP